jgi:hypothetical protein
LQSLETAVSFIGPAKTSDTASLCAIGFELVDKIIEKYYDGKNG